jgi:DNA-directed RNA polymerase subunit F
MRPVEVRFCEKVETANKEECQSLVKDLMSSKDKKEVENILQNLTELTGQSPKQVAQLLYKSCPLCPEDEK